MFLPFTLWTDAVRIDNPSLPIAVDEEHWKDYATEVARVDPNAPDPTSFTDWRIWAVAWVGAS